jgi:YHS domain-containing protein
LHKLAKMTFSWRPAEYVQGVHAFAQTFSQVTKSDTWHRVLHKTSKNKLFSAARRICSGCSGFCTKLAKMDFSRRPAEYIQGVQAFAQTFSQVKKVTHGTEFCTKLAKMIFSRRPAEYVQGVQAFAQTFSQVKKVTRGSFKLFKMFRLFRLFRLLPNLSQETKFPCHTAVSTGCSRCSGCSGFYPNFLKKQSFHATRGSFNRMFKMFRLFRLLPILSQETKFPCHVAVSTRCSRCSGCSGFYPNFLN